MDFEGLARVWRGSGITQGKHAGSSGLDICKPAMLTFDQQRGVAPVNTGNHALFVYMVLSEDNRIDNGEV